MKISSMATPPMTAITTPAVPPLLRPPCWPGGLTLGTVHEEKTCTHTKSRDHISYSTTVTGNPVT